MFGGASIVALVIGIFVPESIGLDDILFRLLGGMPFPTDETLQGLLLLGGVVATLVAFIVLLRFPDYRNPVPAQPSRSQQVPRQGDS